MPNEPESIKTPELDESKTSETPEQKKMNRIANKLAAKAGKRESLTTRTMVRSRGADLPEWHNSRTSFADT